MSKTILLTDVTDDEYTMWQESAARAGVSLSAFVLSELRQDPALLPHDDFMTLLRRRERAPVPLTSAELIREMRGPLPESDDEPS